MTDDDDVLAEIDLHKWQVPPAPDHRRAVLQRALDRTAAPRRRTGWLLAAAVLLNVALAAVVVIGLPGPAAPVIHIAAPAGGGGGPTEAQVEDLLRRLDAERAELQARLAEIDELRTVIAQLSERLHRLEDRDHPPRHPVPPTPTPTPSPSPSPSPTPSPSPSEDSSCDEVSCVLNNYEGTCCARFRSEIRNPFAKELPEALDRTAISQGMASARGRISACGGRSSAHGKVKVVVRVAPDGQVTGVTVAETPEPELGTCVAEAIQVTRFQVTLRGGSFGYPFVF
jgi:outer membrane biosynthesis protein TonB